MTDTATAPTLTPERRRELAAALDRVLTAQLRRVRRRFLLHGLGLALLLPVAAIALAFVLDHTLRLPAPIRLLHTLATAGLCGYALWRFVRYPLRKVLQPVDVALLLEGSFPQLGQRLVSAVQLQAALQQDQLRNQSLAMVEQLLHETAAHTQQLPYERLFDSRRTARIWAGTATVTLLLLAGVFTAPAVAWIFVLRHLGADVAYPKATRLLIELPPAGADLQRQDDGRTTLLTLPGGADLHVSVLAEGTMPAEAFLEVQNPAGENRSIGMTPRPGNRFRHVFRRVAGEFTFHARGGDDDDGDRLVHVRTINPPVVAQIRTRLRPPAYTGRPPSQQTGGAIEALVGTQVDLQVTATAAVSTAVLVFLESGKKLELRPTTVADDAGSVQGFGGAFVVEQSDRYQIDLVGDGGLRNPNPGTYPLAALQDYAPVGHWLVPDDESANLLLADALLCVRIEAHDDYGLVAAALSIETAGNKQEFALLAPASAPALTCIATELYEVKTLLGGQKPGHDGLSLLLELQDNRLPQASTTTLPRRAVQIVDPSQLVAAIAHGFRAMREELEQSHDLQVDRHARLEELLQQGAAPSAATTQVLTGVEVGQGRILSSIERVHRALMRTFDLHLWNRIETSAPAAEVIELYRSWHREHAEAVAFAPGFYREVAQRRQNSALGAMPTTLDPILGMVLLADGLATATAPQATRALAEAQVAKDAHDLAATLGRAVKLQDQIQTVLQQLLARLDEWNDFQDLIQETRALRDRQKDVQIRTEEIRGKK